MTAGVKPPIPAWARRWPMIAGAIGALIGAAVLVAHVRGVPLVAGIADELTLPTPLAFGVAALGAALFLAATIERALLRHGRWPLELAQQPNLLAPRGDEAIVLRVAALVARPTLAEGELVLRVHDRRGERRMKPIDSPGAEHPVAQDLPVLCHAHGAAGPGPQRWCRRPRRRSPSASDRRIAWRRGWRASTREARPPRPASRASPPARARRTGTRTR